ncbi:tRNA (adenosine(37)-N6)-threonylcarbamoyltransferase complex ATPase subunit type 1 TsaE [Sulfurimonas sp. SAG-AH-194-I05]|nr:tRNA (adenosine(37)-N6)-threonylcarbamoyltransferase complex ATPase subunit type 1 TsaE [Sulfurimonas sp. SAG-AH-194-I05]MDF1875783.1 tRNA (adenosine(37)-N6)-threonylcarbamoyltransferase complex ATPase subunit type 1 TsaE [Sulfurimonas sp. SAG-AH-194-I05]
MKTYTLDLDEVDTLVNEVVSTFTKGIIILRGDLACGKTTFVKKMVLKLGYKDEVTSPTFSLQQCYGEKIFHYDIYNHGLEHFIALGMLEELEKEGLHFVEWGDKKLENILKNAGMEVLVIEIKKTVNDIREYKVTHA